MCLCLSDLKYYLSLQAATAATAQGHYMYTHMCDMCVYIYIYIERERDRYS